MEESVRLVDAVCEVVDARIPQSSRNPDIDVLTKNKPRLIILNRADQADPAMTERWKRYFEKLGTPTIETDSCTGRGTQEFPRKIRELLAEKIARREATGQAGRPIRVMVVGVPNVGKSAFINRMSGRRAVKAEDRPGVTRGKQWARVDKGLDMLDTPGILWPKFDDPVVGMRLAWTGAVRDDVTDVEELASELMAMLSEPTSERQFILYEALRKGADVDALYALTYIKPYFLSQMRELVLLEEEIIKHRGGELPDALLISAKGNGSWPLSNKLTLSSGQLLAGLENYSLLIGPGTLTAGAGSDTDLDIYVGYNTTTISATLADNGAGQVALVKHGGGTLVLDGGTGNTYSGGSFVNEGTLTTGTRPNNPYLGTERVVVNNASLTMGSSGATANHTGFDYRAINGGQIQVGNAGYTADDTFSIESGCIIQSSSL